MHPVICKIGLFSVYSYGLMLLAAFFIFSLFATREAKSQGISPELVFNFAFTALITGIIGARIFYVAENLGFYLVNPLEIIMLQRGGLSWFGGLISGSACGIVYLKTKKAGVFKILDLVVPFLALGQAIGRVGCFLNGCCFGKTIVPVQIYSSLLLLIIFVILRLMQDRPPKEGAIFFAYLVLYSLKRFFIEFWRLDNPQVLWGLTLFQLLSIVLFLAAIAGEIIIHNERIHTKGFRRRR